MVADFSQLYQNVLVVGHRVALLDHRLLQQISVDALLLLCDTDCDVNLNLWLQGVFHLFLESSQQEWSEDAMERLDNLLVSSLFLGFGLFDVRVEVKHLIERVR